MNWVNQFKYNPIKPLKNSGNQAIQYLIKRLLDESLPSISQVWALPEVQKILEKQKENGSFKHYKKNEAYPKYHHDLVEAWKRFRLLVNRYELTKDHPKGKKAAEFIFSC